MPRGVENESAKDILRKHLPDAFTGPAWDALIEAVASGDEENFKLAQDAFEQLFISTASGKYLDQRGSGEGLDRPAGVGMSDEVYRAIVIAVTNKKLTLSSLLEVLELYYGPEALRAYIQSAAGPFALSDGLTLSFAFEDAEYLVTFALGDFYNISVAEPVEVVNALNVQLHRQDSAAFATVDVDTAGNEYVRIYSGARGLKGSVQVTGGTAVTALGLPTDRQTIQQDAHTAMVNRSSEGVVITMPVTTRVVERTEETASYLATPLQLDIMAAAVSILENHTVRIYVEASGADALTVGEYVWLDGLQAGQSDDPGLNYWPGGSLNGRGKIIEVGTGYVVVDMGPDSAY